MIQNTMRPIFVIGAARSGTSAICLGLRRGAGLPGYNEGHVLPLLDRLHRTIDEYFSSFGEQALNGVRHNLIAQLDPVELKDYVTSWFVRFREERLGSGEWVDKTPNIRMIQTVPSLAAIFPQARFIFAKRRGIENVLSRTIKFPGFSFETRCQFWTQCMDGWLHVRADLPRERYIEVDLHDIALYPEETAEQVGSFLGLSQEQTDGIKRTWLSERPEQSRMAQDYRYVGLEETGWSEEEKAFFTRVCGSLMDQYGYSLESLIFPEAYQRPVSLYRPIAGIVEEEIATCNVMKDGFRRLGSGFLLHPNMPRKEPAQVRYRNLEFFGHNHFSAGLLLNNPESESVEFRLSTGLRNFFEKCCLSPKIAGGKEPAPLKIAEFRRF